MHRPPTSFSHAGTAMRRTAVIGSAPERRTVCQVRPRWIDPRTACRRACVVSATLRFNVASRPPNSSRIWTAPWRIARSIRAISSRMSPSDSPGPDRLGRSTHTLRARTVLDDVFMHLPSLTLMWHTKGRTARYVHLRIRAVLEWAIAMDWRTDNPCDRLLPVLGPQHDVVEYRKALPHREVVAAIERVRAADPAKVDALAFEFLVLTAARSGEVRGAVWSEIDREAGVWTVPASRMKTARAHRVPLCGRALEILDAARRLGGGGARSCLSTSARSRWAASS